MGFYLVVHTILGFVAACPYLLNRSNVLEKPLWMSGGFGALYISLATPLASLGATGALVVTFSEYGLGWSFATLGALVLGCVIARLIPVEIQPIVAMICPIVVVVICGALFGFWYI